MGLLGQGIVLMVAGMGIVYLFLGVLIAVTGVSSKFVAKFDSILPQDAPKKAPKKVVSNDDANVALAVAVALRG